MTTLAAFDLGIKNLSYCLATFDASGGLTRIDRWTNMNLLAEGAEAQSQTRCPCGGPASYNDVTGGRLYCKRCSKKSAKPVLELTPGAKVDEWRTWAAANGFTEKRATKKAIEEFAATKRLMPYKPPKAKGVSLQQILAGMETCLTTELPHLATASRIRIENQPSEFAPHMKSVQIMLFTLLDHRLRTECGWTGTMEFVNASVKTRGAGIDAGKQNKRSRKLAGIERVTAVLTAASAHEKLQWWKAQAKQDDLADALLMCLDGVQTSS